MGKNLDIALIKYADEVINAAREGLGKKISRQSIRASWKGGRPTSVRYSSIYAKIDDTGSLSRSMKSRLRATSNVEITMLAYGQAVDQGRREHGKGIPQHKLKSWIRRRVHSELDVNTLTFLINRKIRFFGIEPTNFIDKAFDVVDSSDNDYITDGVFEDLVDDIERTNNLILN